VDTFRGTDHADEAPEKTSDAAELAKENKTFPGFAWIVKPVFFPSFS